MAVAIGAGTEVVELPKYEVNAAPLHTETWHKMELEDILIYYTVNDKDAVEIVDFLRNSIPIVSYIYPEIKTPGSFPFALILCGNDSLMGFQLQMHAGTSPPADSFVIYNKDGFHAENICIYSSLYKQLSKKKIMLQYLKFRMEQQLPAAPAWYAQAILYFTHSALTDTDQFGNPILYAFPRTMERDDVSTVQLNLFGGKSFTAHWHTRYKYTNEIPGMLPFDEFFCKDNKAGNEMPSSEWRVQCDIFMHYCLHRENSEFKKAYNDLVKKASTGPVTEGIFKSCFGSSYKSLWSGLKKYQQENRFGNEHGRKTLVVKNRPELPDVETKIAPRTEVARIKGIAFAAMGKYNEARQEMLYPYNRQKADPPLYAALGQLEYDTGNIDKARPLLESAVKNNVSDPEAYRTLAKIRFADAVADLPAGETQLSVVQVAPALELLLKARSLPPESPRNYILLAQILSKTRTPPPKPLVAMLTNASRLMWQNVTLNVEVARLLVAKGMPEKARPAMERALIRCENLDKEDIAWLAQAAGNPDIPVTPEITNSPTKRK
jgi:tetratricopeptide (TPR) repeat protein